MTHNAELTGGAITLLESLRVPVQFSDLLDSFNFKGIGKNDERRNVAESSMGGSYRIRKPSRFQIRVFRS